jgi:hypothetical protein
VTVSDAPGKDSISFTISGVGGHFTGLAMGSEAARAFSFICPHSRLRAGAIFFSINRSNCSNRSKPRPPEGRLPRAMSSNWLSKVSTGPLCQAK